MEIILSILTGLLFACGFYMMLRRTFARVIIGILFISQAANLAILTTAGVGDGTAPIVPKGETTLNGAYPDPLPQALILTAIVIGFGVFAFAVVLFKRAYLELNTDDLDALESTDR